MSTAMDAYNYSHAAFNTSHEEKLKLWNSCLAKFEIANKLDVAFLEQQYMEPNDARLYQSSSLLSLDDTPIHPLLSVNALGWLCFAASVGKQATVQPVRIAKGTGSTFVLVDFVRNTTTSSEDSFTKTSTATTTITKTKYKIADKEIYEEILKGGHKVIPVDDKYIHQYTAGETLSKKNRPPDC
jgi:hypothetical protein